ncbi:MAG: hypothetical protein JSW54_13080 [Fidelibacterota bacterium]|nr:MAG: hypothetical protein JSW54_13080 [Candidatus Neomarinimicrobiota bacterium]
MRVFTIALAMAAIFGSMMEAAYGQSVSVIISERTINDFLAAIGPVSGKGTGAQKIPYTWTVNNPRVDLEKGTAGFKAAVKVKTKIITFEDRVAGRLAVDYDAGANKIRMQVVEAKFPIYVRVLGRKVKLATLDIGKYYRPKFEFNGPEPVQQQVEMDVGDGTTRVVGVTAGSREILMEKDRLRVSVNLSYAAIKG